MAQIDEADFAGELARALSRRYYAELRVRLGAIAELGRARLFMGFAGLRLQCVSIRIANDGSSWPGTVASARQSTCPKALGPRSEGLSPGAFGTAFRAPPPWCAIASRRR